MSNLESVEKKERTKISKLHFLIHPGFNTDPDEMGYLGNAHQYAYLMNRYLARAKEMGPDELMVAFLHTKKDRLESDIQKGKTYIRTVKELKNILGKQLIVISDRYNVNIDPLAYETAKKIIEARGYCFDKDVFTEAFGECYGICVNRAKRNLQETGKFENEIPINRQLTDGALDNKSPKTTIE